VEEKAIIIVGSGPAGVATALSLQQLSPNIASETLILEKEIHPRHKLCGGGITEYGDRVLETLGIQPKADSFPIHSVSLRFDSDPTFVRRPNLMRIVRRDEFDAELVRLARSRGIDIRENEAVTTMTRNNEFIEVRTRTGKCFRTRVLVGADGANSIVRRKMIPEKRSRVSRLMEVVLEVDPVKTEAFQHHQALFDFTGMRQGYLWEFPSHINGEAFLNIGIFDSRISGGERSDLKVRLSEFVHERGLCASGLRFMAHPERWFSPRGRYSAPNVLLVGDAAGIEPWFGEGISIALGYGRVAARALNTAFDNCDFTFSAYRSSIFTDKLGKILLRNLMLAKLFYAKRLRSQRLISVLLKLAARKHQIHETEKS